MSRAKPKGISKSKYAFFIAFMILGRLYCDNVDVFSQERLQTHEITGDIYNNLNNFAQNYNIVITDDDSPEKLDNQQSHELDITSIKTALEDIVPIEQIEIIEEPISFEPTKYSHLFEELRVRPIEYAENQTNVVYLTFDDGPSGVTEKILDTLSQYGVKGTFFVQGTNLNSEQNVEILKRIQREGHAIGAHTETHIYKEIYASVDAFLEDFYTAWNKIYEITGEKTYLYRFPGGSYNSFNKNIIKDVTAEIENRGFVYYDWNVSSEDSIALNVSIESILENSTKSNGYSRCILLMHDSAPKLNTAEALPKIIEYYMQKGYSFEVLTPEVKPIQF